MHGFSLTFQGVQHMDPTKIPGLVTTLLALAGQVEAQAAGLNPATSTALKRIASQIRTQAQSLAPPLPETEAPAEGRAPPPGAAPPGMPLAKPK